MVQVNRCVNQGCTTIGALAGLSSAGGRKESIFRVLSAHRPEAVYRYNSVAISSTIMEETLIFYRVFRCHLSGVITCPERNSTAAHGKIRVE
jgi:hypothetical protein